jgi:NTE family protein
MIYGQNPNLRFTLDGQSVSTDTIDFKLHSYQQLKLKAGHYFPLHPHWTLITQFNSGVNFNYQELSLNFYSVGGINDFIRNQVPFVGLAENQVNAASVAAFMTGVQFEPFNNIVTTFRANVGLYDFVDKSPDEITKNFLSGYAISGGYRSAIGPIEISLIYSDQAKQFKGYVNLGFTF